MIFRGILANLLVLGVLASAETKELQLGDPSPKLEVKEFVKGEPVASLEKGQIYVIEFWATWCGPCRFNVPRMTELQKKHKDVIFIGVSVWELDAKGIKPFVEKMGDKMDYRVAADDGLGNDGKMAINWLKAANQNGIPAAFIINKDNKVAWIGHPMNMAKPLEQIVAGTYDIAAAKAEAKKAALQQAKFQELTKKVVEAQKAGEIEEVLQMVKELDELTEGKNPGIVHFLAKAYFDYGDAVKAVETEKRVLKLVKGTPSENHFQIKEALKKYKEEIEDME